jgi:hypothetical protein
MAHGDCHPAGRHRHNSATTADPTWKPFLLNKAGDAHVSPCFPAYTSEHATFGGTWARIMQLYFGTDAITFAATGDPMARGVTRTFTSLSAAAAEDAISRIYPGVHYRFDADFGLSSGKSVAKFVFSAPAPTALIRLRRSLPPANCWRTWLSVGHLQTEANLHRWIPAGLVSLRPRSTSRSD